MPPSSLLSNVQSRVMKNEPNSMNNPLSFGPPLPFLIPSTSIASFNRFPPITITSNEVSKPKGTSTSSDVDERLTIDSQLSTNEDHKLRPYLVESIKSENDVNPDDATKS